MAPHGTTSLRTRIESIPPKCVEGAILLLALLVRFWRLGYHSIWFDEAVSLRWASSDIGYTWNTTFALVQDKHPPIYYVTLGLWQQLLNGLGLAHNDSAIRALGSLLGVLTVWAILRLSSQLSGHATSYLAGILVALSPVLTWYSQELRMFQPATTAISVGSLSLWLAWRTQHTMLRLAWWTVLVVALSAALYTYLFSAFIMPVVGLTLLVLFWRERSWRKFIEGILSLLIVTLIFVPLARNAWLVNDAESTPGQPFGDFAPNLFRLLQIDTVWRVDWSPTWVSISLFLFSLFLLAGLFIPWHRRAPNAEQTQVSDAALGMQPNKLDQLWLWLWVGIPLLIANLLLARSHSIFAEDRYLIFMAPFVLWAIARGVMALAAWWSPLGWLGTGATILPLLLALPLLWTPARARENWRLAAATIEEYTAASPSLPSSVVTHIDYTHDALEWYLRRHYTFEQLPVFFPFGGALHEEETDSVIAPPLNGIVDFGSATLWLTQSHLAGVDDNRLVEAWLNRTFPIITEQYPAGVKLSGYVLQGRFKEVPELGPYGRTIDAEVIPGLQLAACEITTPQVAATDEFAHPPSGWVHTRLWWRATEAITQDYTSTVQVIGPQGVWGDKLTRATEPMRFWPTSTWQVGDVVRDEADINLNPLTPPGDYPVIIGLSGADGQPVGEAIECGSVGVR